MQSQHDDALASAILETVRLPILALDSDLRVETANDAFLDQFRVTREETARRLIFELGNGQWNIPELRRLLSEVLPEKSAVSGFRVEHDFERIGRRIMVVSARRIARPGLADMILVALADETESEALRAELGGRIELADKLFDSMREGLLILDPDLRIRSASGSFYDLFRVDPSQTVGHLIYELGNGQWDIPELRTLLEDVLPRQRSFDDYEVTQTFEGLGKREMLLNGRRLDHLDLILLAIRDITDARESAARLKEVARTANIGVFESDRRTGNLYWSPEMRDIIGYPQDRPPPADNSVPDFIHPEDKPAVAALLASAVDPAGGGAIFHEHRIVRPDGAIRWVQMHGRVEFAATAGELRPVRIRGVLLDVTERKAAEDRLRESEERYRSLFEAIDEGFCVIECRFDEPGGQIDYRVLEANPAFYERTGFPQAILGRWLREAAPKLEEQWYEIYGRVARTREPIRFEQKSEMLGRWFDVYAFPIDDPKDNRAAVLFSDISERKRHEDALRESEARYHALFERAVDGIWLARPDGVFVDVNPAGCAMLGYSRETHLGLSVADLTRPEEAYRLRELMGAIGAGENVTDIWDARRADGTWLTLEQSHSTTPDGYWQAIGRDITERRRAEAHQAMLMAELDHRVKNILAVVQSIARQSLGRGQPIEPEAADRLVGRIDALAQSHALLASSRWQGAHFSQLVESAVAPYRAERADRIMIVGPDLKVTPKAAQTLTLAFHELVTNAAKYGSLSREDGSVTAEWHFDGEGPDRRLIFRWKERGGPPIEEPPQRKGFGSRLIERTLSFDLGGDVVLDYARDGLRVVTDLPLEGLRVADEQYGTTRRSDHPPIAGSTATLENRRILVAEDEHLIGQEVADALRSARCLVTGPLGTLQQALSVAVSEDLDAAVLDINLNGELVWPVARALQARGVPVVFTTGYSDTLQTPPDLANAQRIEKPIRRDRLLAALAAGLAGKPGA